MNAFDKHTADLANLATLTAQAAQVFDGAEGLISVRSYYGRPVTVQMKEEAVVAWCEAHGVTPAVSEHEEDYTPYGGGFTTYRRHDAVVSESEVGRILLVSSEVASTRPAVAPTSTEGESAAA
jgi:hypothetical protein